MDRRTALGTFGSVLATGVVGCVSVPALGETGDIGMSATDFEPVIYRTVVDEPVVWYNSSSRAHTVTAYEGGRPDGTTYFASGGFDSETAARAAWSEDRSGNFYSGDTYRHTFERAGTYHYFCIPHESGGMVGRIEVAERD